MRQTFTKKYIELNKQLHNSPKGFGGGGHKQLPSLLPILDDPDYKINTILDYGAGQGTMKTALEKLNRGYQITNYDPARPEYDQKPQGNFDLVICTDVLEHIEPQYIDAVIEDLKDYSKCFLYLVIVCTPANKVLPDGRNAHILQRPPEWWNHKLIVEHNFKHLYWHLNPDKENPDRIKKISWGLIK